MARLKKTFSRVDPGFIILLAICVIAVLPFISRPGLPQETDAELHVFRLHELSLLIRGGELYPRWAPNFYHGYGYPIFNYYAPLTYYLGFLVEIMPWFDAVAGVKAVFILGMLLAGLGMYGFVRDNWGRAAGYVAAAAYLYAPYIQYIDPHARGVLAESFSFGAFAMALWAVDRLRRRPTRWRWAAAVLATAAVILSHNLMALLFFALLAGWAAWMLLFPEGPGEAHLDRRRFLPLAALFTGLALAAFFWLPVIAERDAVNLNTLIGAGDNFDFRTHFLSLTEMLSFSLRLDWAASEPAFRFNLGVAQWVLGAAGLLLLALRRVRHPRQLRFFALAALALLFLMLPVSTLIWEKLPFLPYFQFPWRLLGAAAALLAVLAGAGTEALLRMAGTARLGAERVDGRRGPLSAALLPLLVLLPIFLGLPLSQPAPWTEFGDVSTLRMSLIEQKGRWLGTTSTSDFVPATAAVIPRRNDQMMEALFTGQTLDRVNRAPGMVPQGAEVTAENLTPLDTRYHISTPESFLLRLFQFDFPGWRAAVDGQPVEIELGMPEGFIVVPVPAGEHQVDITFGSTPSRTAAAALSWTALLITLLVGWKMGAAAASEPAEALPLEPLPGWGVPLLPLLIALIASLLLLTPTGLLHHQSTPGDLQVADFMTAADFDDQIALIGYDIDSLAPAAGDTVSLSLYWQAQTEMEINYQVFVHLIDVSGRLVTQSDKLNPGEFPTKRWPLDKYVRDDHQLKLPEGLPPGDYAVSVGMWVQSEGWRLPLLDDSGTQIGDNFRVLTLSVHSR